MGASFSKCHKQSAVDTAGPKQIKVQKFSAVLEWNVAVQNIKMKSYKSQPNQKIVQELREEHNRVPLGEDGGMEGKVRTMFNVQTGHPNISASGLKVQAEISAVRPNLKLTEDTEEETTTTITKGLLELYLQIRFKDFLPKIKKNTKVGLRIVNEAEALLYCGGLQPAPMEEDSKRYIIRWEAIEAKLEDKSVLRLRFDFSWCDQDEEESIHLRTEKLHGDLLKSLDSGVGSDFKLVCGGVTFTVHTGILSARSNVFARMFEVEMKEKEARTADICDMDPKNLKILLEYIYAARLNLFALKFSDIAALARAGDKYELEQLKEMCLDHLEKDVTHTNCGEVAVLAYLLNAKERIRQNIYRYCSTNWIELARLPEFQKWVTECPKAFLEIVEQKPKQQAQTSTNNGGGDGDRAALAVQTTSKALHPSGLIDSEDDEFINDCLYSQLN